VLKNMVEIVDDFYVYLKKHLCVINDLLPWPVVI